MTKPSLITGCLQATDTSVIKVIPVLGVIGCGQRERFSVLLLEQTTGYSLKMEKAILTPTKIPMAFLSHGVAAIPPSFVSSSNLSPFQFFPFFPCTSDYLCTYFWFFFFLLPNMSSVSVHLPWRGSLWSSECHNSPLMSSRLDQLMLHT